MFIGTIGQAWTNNTKIQKFMKEHNMDHWSKLQAYFFWKMEEVIRGMDKIMYGWQVLGFWFNYFYYQDTLTSLLPKQVVQTWTGKVTDWLISVGRPQIYSKRLFLDLTEYPIDYYNEEIPSHESVLGGEACMWSEYVETGSLSSFALNGQKLWHLEFGQVLLDLRNYSGLHIRRIGMSYTGEQTIYCSYLMTLKSV